MIVLCEHVSWDSELVEETGYLPKTLRVSIPQLGGDEETFFIEQAINAALEKNVGFCATDYIYSIL
jgi:hypothetical protein